MFQSSLKSRIHIHKHFHVYTVKHILRGHLNIPEKVSLLAGEGQYWTQKYRNLFWKSGYKRLKSHDNKGWKRQKSYENWGQNLKLTKMWVKNIALESKRKVKRLSQPPKMGSKLLSIPKLVKIWGTSIQAGVPSSQILCMTNLGHSSEKCPLVREFPLKTGFTVSMRVTIVDRYVH